MTMNQTFFFSNSKKLKTYSVGTLDHLMKGVQRQVWKEKLKLACDVLNTTKFTLFTIVERFIKNYVESGQTYSLSNMTHGSSAAINFWRTALVMVHKKLAGKRHSIYSKLPLILKLNDFIETLDINSHPIYNDFQVKALSDFYANLGSEIDKSIGK